MNSDGESGKSRGGSGSWLSRMFGGAKPDPAPGSEDEPTVAQSTFFDGPADEPADRDSTVAEEQAGAAPAGDGDDDDESALILGPANWAVVEEPAAAEEDSAGEDAGADETTAEDTAAEETAAEETAAEETAAEDTTAEDTTAEDTAAEETTAEDTADEETTDEETTDEETTDEETAVAEETTAEAAAGEEDVGGNQADDMGGDADDDDGLIRTFSGPGDEAADEPGDDAGDAVVVDLLTSGKIVEDADSGQWPTDFVPGSAPDPGPSPGPGPSPDSGAIPDAGALEDTIREIIRAELEGEIGQRLSKNIKRMIRDEVANAMSRRD